MDESSVRYTTYGSVSGLGEFGLYLLTNAACFDTFSKTQVSRIVNNHHYNFDLVLLSGGHLVVLEDELSIMAATLTKDGQTASKTFACPEQIRVTS